MSLIVDNIRSEGYLSGNTFYAITAEITNLSVTNITGASTTDYYVTGGTFSAGTLTLDRNGLSAVTITGFTTGSGSGTLTGTGIADKVAFWTDSSGLSATTNFSWDSANERFGVGITSPSAKVHITNTGSTDSFLVEDSANPDTSPFVIDQFGSVGIGTTAPTNLLEVNGGNILAWRFATNPNIIQRRSNGTSGSESNVLANEIIGYNNFQAFQSTGLWPNVGRVGALADGDQSSTSMPTRLSLWTTPSGSTTITERMRINNQGNVAIGTTTFDSTNPEKFVVAPSNQNAIVAKGPIAGFMQLNIQNTSNATNASSDVVATNDTGTDLVNYVDMGINSSTYTGGNIGVANDAYLYNIGRELYIGNATTTGTTGNVKFFAGNVATSILMTLTTNQRVGVSTTNPVEKLHVSGNTLIEGAFSAFTSSGINIISGNTSTDMLRITQVGSGNALVVEDSANPDSTPFVVNSSGRTGIGTTSPLTLLHVGLGTIDSTSLITLQTQWATDNGKTGSIDWRDTLDIVGSIDTRYDGSTVDLHLGSLYNLGYNSTTRMIIKGGGNIGIGTTEPREKLEVSGNTIITGNVSGDSISITTTPTLNNTNTEILTRNSSTGNLEYSTAPSTAFYPYGIGFAQSIGNYLT